MISGVEGNANHDSTLAAFACHQHRAQAFLADGNVLHIYEQPIKTQVCHHLYKVWIGTSQPGTDGGLAFLQNLLQPVCHVVVNSAFPLPLVLGILPVILGKSHDKEWRSKFFDTCHGGVSHWICEFQAIWR